MALSFAQLEGVWLQAARGTQYATQSWAALMAAIAEAESGGNPDATNPNDNGGRQTSWGLWQISLGNHNAPAPNWNDPYENASLAIGKLNGQGLGAWGTYTSGAYKQFVPAGVVVPTTAGVGSGGAAGAAQGTNRVGCDSSNCVVNNPFGGIPIIGGGPCLINKCQQKAFISAVELVFGAFLFGFGVVMLAAYEYDRSGAKQAVNKTAKTIGVGAALFAGQPEAAGLLAASGKGKKPKTLGVSSRGGTPAKPKTSTLEELRGRRVDKDIDRQVANLKAQGQEIGPRGGSETSQRVAREHREGRGQAGASRGYESREGQRARRAREGFRPSAGDA